MNVAFVPAPVARRLHPGSAEAGTSDRRKVLAPGLDLVLLTRLMRRGGSLWFCGRVLVLASLSACGPKPSVRYLGTNFGRAPKPVEEMEVIRTGDPEGRFQDLGTVVVTCPSEAKGDFSGDSQFNGCTYEWAVWQARSRAATNGGDGIHAVETAVNSSGKVVNLQASVFVRLPPRVSASPEAAGEPKPAVEQRLRELEKLKADRLITPEEYATKRAEILKDI